MRKPVRNEDKNGCLVGVELTRMLIARQMTHDALAKQLGFERSRIYEFITGTLSLTPDTIQKIVVALKLPEQEQYRLHIAAARDYGYRIPLITYV